MIQRRPPRLQYLLSKEDRSPKGLSVHRRPFVRRVVAARGYRSGKGCGKASRSLLTPGSSHSGILRREKKPRSRAQQSSHAWQVGSENIGKPSAAPPNGTAGNSPPHGAERRESTSPHKDPNVETIQTAMGGRTDQQMWWGPYSGIVCSPEKEWSPDTGYHPDGP